MGQDQPSALPDYEALYRAVVASHGDPVSRYAPDCTLRSVSDAYCALFGRSHDELIGCSILDFVPDEQRTAAQQRLNRVSVSDPVVSGRNTIIRPDGATRQVEWVTTGFFDENEELIEFQSVGRDVTLLVEARSALARTQTQYDLAVQIANIGYFVWDEKNNRLAHCSEEAAAIYGVTVEQAMARSASLEGNLTPVHDDDRDRYHEALDSAERNLRAYDVTFRVMRPTGEVRWIREVAEPVLDDDGCLVQTIGTLQDVTEQKLAEEELRRAEEDLRQSNEQLHRLFAIISHDLRGPFTPLLGFSDLLSKNARDLSPETVQDYGQSIHRIATQLHLLLDDLLDWAQTQQEGVTITPSDTDALAVAERHERMHAEVAALKGVTIESDLPDQPCPITADTRILDTVLRNLLSNAIKFSPVDGVVRLSVEPEGNGARFTISDSGAGISEDVCSQLRSDGIVSSAPGTAGERGTGMGLTLCRKLLEQHGSQLAIATEPRGGTTVSFRIGA